MHQGGKLKHQNEDEAVVDDKIGYRYFYSASQKDHVEFNEEQENQDGQWHFPREHLVEIVKQSEHLGKIF